MKTENKVIVVTGGGAGIGRELVIHLLAKGAKVMAADINESGLQETTSLAKEKSGALQTAPVDLAKKESVIGLYQKTIEAFGHVDGIINNAGIIQPFVKVNDLSFDAIEHVVNVNFYGTLYMIKTFLPHLLTRPEAHIVNISSMGGFIPVPGQTIYGATKAAVKLLTEGLHSELRDTKVRVMVVFPGAVRTNITANSGVEIKQMATSKSASIQPLPPEKAAEQIIDGMENDRYRVLVGKDASFLDKLYRLNPAYAARFIAEKMKSLLG